MAREWWVGQHLNLGPKLKKEFYCVGAKKLAQELLGKILISVVDNSFLCGRIVETEAYLGKKDPASHSYQGKITPRNSIMYEEAGLIYVYMIYGMHWCFNIVANKKGVPEAVFIRALEPLEGIEIMKRNNPLAKSIRYLTNGPSRWTKSFGIDKRFLGLPIYGNQIFIVKEKHPPSFKIKKTKRIGIDYAQEAKDWLLRFYIEDNPFVSGS